MKKKSLIVVVLLLMPLKVYATQLTVINQGEIIELIDHEYYVTTYLDPFFVKERKLNDLMKDLNGKIMKHPTNAMFNEQGDLIEGGTGIKLDKEKFTSLFLDYFYRGQSMTIEVPKSITYPRVTSELLARINEKRIGDYVTYYNEDNQERTHNIYLSTMAINNQVVFPGEIFSFNQIVGERTIEKGYQKAPVIVKGELAEDIGGGICQVSSTLFNAVSLKGVQMVERYSHSRPVPYVPPGQDATVSWWGPDFVFKNNYSQPLLIKAMSSDGKMKIYIYTAEDAYIRSSN